MITSVVLQTVLGHFLDGHVVQEVYQLLLFVIQFAGISSFEELKRVMTVTQMMEMGVVGYAQLSLAGVVRLLMRRLETIQFVYRFAGMEKLLDLNFVMMEFNLTILVALLIVLQTYQVGIALEEI